MVAPGEEPGGRGLFATLGVFVSFLAGNISSLWQPIIERVRFPLRCLSFVCTLLVETCTHCCCSRDFIVLIVV